MWVSGHLVSSSCSPLKHTMFPSCRLRNGWFHLLNHCNVKRYSVDHLCQKCRTSVWQRCHHCSKDKGWGENEFSGIASRGQPMRKWPGVSAPIPSSTFGRGVSGLKFKHASICTKIVVNSSKLSWTSPITRLKCYLKLLTAASYRPPKCNACFGVKYQLMFYSVQRSKIDCCSFALLRNKYNLSNSFATPTKLVPLSLHIVDGLPCLETNRHCVPINAAVVKFDIYSRCTALVVNETDTLTYTLVMIHLQIGQDLIKIGPG